MRRLLLSLALVPIAVFSRDTNRYDSVVRTADGVELSQRGGLGPSNFVVTAVSYGDLFEDINTNETGVAAEGFKRAVDKYAPSLAQDFDATKLENLPAFYDNLRTNRTPAARLAFSNAVASVAVSSEKVKSVNGKDGEVVLTAEDVGALPDTYTPPPAPVQSVNGKTGDVVLAAGDVGALPLSGGSLDDDSSVSVRRRASEDDPPSATHVTSTFSASGLTIRTSGLHGAMSTVVTVGSDGIVSRAGGFMAASSASTIGGTITTYGSGKITKAPSGAESGLEYLLPDESGTLATREWVADNASPADYANVSNAAMNARSMTDLSVLEATGFEYVSGLPSGFTVYDPPVWEISYWVCGVEDSDGNITWVFDYDSPEFATELSLDRSFDSSPVGFTLVFRATGTVVSGNRLATMTDLNADSLRTMLVDANTNPEADCECIKTNMCNLVHDGIVETVNTTKSRFFDSGLGVEWTFVPMNGEFMLIATTNVNREVIE